MKQKKSTFFLIFFLALTLISPLAVAGEGTGGDYAREIGEKFGRGLVNVLSSPAEIPCTINEDIEAQGGSGFFSGFGKGIVFMARRILVGVTEIGTFIIPMERTIPPVCQETSGSHA